MDFQNQSKGESDPPNKDKVADLITKQEKEGRRPGKESKKKKGKSVPKDAVKTGWDRDRAR